MTAVLGVRFGTHGALHLLRAGDHQRHQVGDRVLYPTTDGLAIAEVVWSGQVAQASDAPVCQGSAEPADEANEMADRTQRAEIELVARRLIAEHGLPMRVLAVDHAHPEPDQPMAVVYYTAPNRVDFRELVSELTRILRCKVDLRQVGDRDAACLVGDLGSCGLQACCTTYLRELQPVPIPRRGLPMADQGSCGRAMCCLGFEACNDDS